MVNTRNTKNISIMFKKFTRNKRIKCLTYKNITMIITNKITGRNISTEYLALLSGLITNDEFELITLTIK